MPTTTQRTHCTNCGAKLPEQPLSLCAYCAMPLELADAGVQRETAGESPHAQKIAKILQQEGLAEALAWVPPEGARYQQARRSMARGKLGALLSAVLIVAGGWSGGWSGPWALACVGIGSTGLLAGAAAWLRGRSACHRILLLPLLRRPAYIRDRRSETEVVGWGGRTMYFFELELEGGSVAEFSYPGRGANEEPYVNGMTGVAYTRGTELLHFRHVRI